MSSIWGQANPTGVTGYNTTTETSTNYGVWFTVAASGTVTGIWFYSHSGATVLPTGTALFKQTAQGAGTLLASNPSPAWSGAAGSGWVQDTGFPHTAVTPGNVYAATYFAGATALQQSYIYTGSSPAAWFPTTSSDSNITAPESEFGFMNGPYQGGGTYQTLPSSNNTNNLNWLADVNVTFASAYPALRQPVRARIPAARPARGVYTGTGLGDTSYGTGQVQWDSGTPARNPTAGPVFRQATQVIRARVAQAAPRGRVWSNPGGPVQNPAPAAVVYQRAGQAVRARFSRPVAGSVTGRGSAGAICGAVNGTGFGSGNGSAGAPVRNPAPGPVFTQKTAPVRYVLPPWQPRAGRIGSSFGAPVENPVHGPPVYAPQGPARARLPELAPRAGRTASSAGAPVRNPVAGPAFRQRTQPAQARLPLPARGRVYVFRVSAVAVTPPLAGPPFYPAVQAIRARLPLQPLLRGRSASNAGAPARNPSPGPRVYPLPGPVRARLPELQPRAGRVTVSASSPVVNPQLSAPPLQASGQPAGIRVIYLRTGHAQSTQTPVAAAAPAPSSGPVFYPRNFAKAQLPLARRGTCRAIRFGSLAANPGPGPVFTQATSPARARIIPPPRGRIAFNPGGPVQNPPPPVQGPVFRQKPSPARIRPSLPPRGRTASGTGAPVRNPVAGPVFRQAVKPAQARIPLPARGRTSGNAGTPPPKAAPVYPLHGPVQARRPLPPHGRVASNPGTPPPAVAPVYPWRGPVRVHPLLPPRGRVASNPGGPVAPPPVPAPVYPWHGPVRIRPVLPSRGRASGHSGIPVVPPPVPAPVYPLHGPVQARRPLPPHGRAVTGNPGAPVRNPQPGPVFRQAVRPIRGIIPQNAPRGRTWSNPGGPVENIPVRSTSFTYGTPYFDWGYGIPYFNWEFGTPDFDWDYGTPSTS